MKTLLATLTLLTLGALTIACDLESASDSSAEAVFREEIIPPTKPAGTTFIGKGGHDNPFEILMLPYPTVPLHYQTDFESELETQARDAIVAEFLADEHNLEECPWQCEDLRASWNEGVNVSRLRLEHGEVSTQTDEAGDLHWESEVSAAAQVGCACE